MLSMETPQLMVLTLYRQNLLYNKMRLLLVFLILFHESNCMSAIEPAKNEPALPSNSSLAVNTTIGNEGPRSFINTRNFARNATTSTLETINCSLFMGPTAPALCALDSHKAARNTSSWLPAAATRGVFFNSTSGPSATGSVRTPSSAGFAAFSSGAPVQSQVSVSFLAAVVFCYLISSGDQFAVWTTIGISLPNSLLCVVCPRVSMASMLRYKASLQYIGP